MKTLLLIFILSFAIIGCSHEDVPPILLSTNGYDLAGQHHVPAVGTITTSVKITNNLLVADRVEFSTSPITFGSSNTFVVGSRNGEILFFSSEDSLSHRLALPSHAPIVEILTDSTELIAMQLDGSVSAITKQGKITWQKNIGKMPLCNSLFTGEKIIVAVDSSLVIINASNGAIESTLPLTLTPRSLAYNESSKMTAIALSWNSSEGSDSILCIDHNGKVRSRVGFPGLRITSNIMILDGENVKFAFGYLGELTQGGSVRRTFLALYDGVVEGKAHLIAKQEVPYIVTNVAANNDIIMSSGFREHAGELSSGIDAFSHDGLTKRWQRRFTEPLVNPVALSRSLVHFTLHFTTQAETPTSAIFYTLDANDGKSEKEFAVPGVHGGFTPGMPMPRGTSGFILADANEPTIYYLKP